MGRDREFMRTLLILSAQLCYEPKNALYKKKSIFKKKKNNNP